MCTVCKCAYVVCMGMCGAFTLHVLYGEVFSVDVLYVWVCVVCMGECGEYRCVCICPCRASLSIYKRVHGLACYVTRSVCDECVGV